LEFYRVGDKVNDLILILKIDIWEY
jgi:hypothetical protein